MKLPGGVPFYLCTALLVGCASYRGPDRVPSINVGGCYYYERPTVWWRDIGNEKLNPKYYRCIGLRPKADAITDEYYVRNQDVYYLRAAFHEPYLRRFSTEVPCSVIDSLHRVARPL